jgi:hypothetical protein
MGRLSSKQIEDRIADLRARLADEQAAVAAAQEALEGALSEKREPGKALSALADARAKAEALESLLAKAAAELDRALDREAREREATRLKSTAAEAKKRLTEVRAAADKLLAAVKTIGDLLPAFDAGAEAYTAVFGDGIPDSTTVKRPINARLAVERIAERDWAGVQATYISLGDFAGWLTGKVNGVLGGYTDVTEIFTQFAARRSAELTAPTDEGAA